MINKISTINPLSKMPGFEAMQAQQEAFMKAMTGGLSQGWTAPKSSSDEPKTATSENSDDLDGIKQQLAELQEKLSKLS